MADIGSALGNTKTDKEYFSRLNSLEDDGLKNIQTRRKGLEENAKYAQTDEQMDPQSAVNVGYRQMLKQVSPSLAKLPNFDTLTVATSGPLEKISEAYLKAQSNRSDQEFNRMIKLDDLNRKRENFTDKQVETFTGRYEKSGIPRLDTAISRLEKRAGKSIDQMNEKDLDGFGRAQNIAPDWLYGMAGSDKGVKDRGDVAEIFNAIRHGDFAGNLTKNEQELFERSNPSGVMVPEKATLESLRRAKQVVGSKKHNYTAGLNPEAKRKAVERGVLQDEDDGLDAKVQAARAAGYSDEEIQEFLNRGR
jgi:hypothetical protein